MYCSIVAFASPPFDALIALRHLVLREPLGLEFTTADLSEEYDSLHLACYDQLHNLLGCLVLKPLSDHTVKMRQVAVRPDMQKNGVGRLLVEFCEIVAKEHGFATIELSARSPAVAFYEKLAYERVGGQYQEIGIDHQKMKKVL